MVNVLDGVLREGNRVLNVVGTLSEANAAYCGIDVPEMHYLDMVKSF